MRRVLLNLILNAIQALAGLDVERRIEIRARTEGDGAEPLLVIEVEDTGAGIPPATLERLFEPFFTTKPMGEGTGLGLTIIKGIVETHSGTIEGLNAPAGGALFRIRLPAITQATTAPAAPAAAGSPGAPATPGSGSALPDGTVADGSGRSNGAATRDDSSGTARTAHDGGTLTGSQLAPETPPETAHVLRVLVIDDEPELQRALRRVLGHLGCEVVTALDGETGVQHAREQAFDLVLCDVRIPGLHGPALLDRMRLQAPDAARVMVFMTGDTITREIREFVASSGRPSLTKPFGRAQLQQILGNVRADRG
jgi:CheY-like chemotaxis protein